MKLLDKVIAELQSRADCHFRPATGTPLIPADLRLPADVVAFYKWFGDARLFSDDGLSPRCRILPPEQFVQVGDAIMGEPTTVGIERSWYAIADVCDGNYLGIDLLPSRLGWCYDCFHETYGCPGYCKVIARSFTELLNCFSKAGDSVFWLNQDFRGYGDAYDESSRA